MKNIILMMLVVLLCSCKTVNMEQGEIRKATGLLIINQEFMSSWFYVVNDRKSKILYQIDSEIGDKDLYAFNKISKPIKTLSKIKLSAREDSDLRYVWVNIDYHAREDTKNRLAKGKCEYNPKYNIINYFDVLEVDKIEPLSSKEDQIYSKVMDSLKDVGENSIYKGDWWDDRVVVGREHQKN